MVSGERPAPPGQLFAIHERQHHVKRSSVRRAAAPAVLTLGLLLTACGAANEQDSDGGDDSNAGEEGGSELSGTLNGAGASSQAAAMEAWQVGFTDANPDVTVNYDPIGSGGGREQFLAGGVTFAGSDAYLDDEELTTAAERCGDGEVIELPNYISPIAVAFNLEGVDNLNLDAATIAGIFNQDITEWDDPAIADQNPDAELPAEPIVPVNRSDESGTTENFVDYLSATAPDAWPHEVSGDWPVPGGEQAQGTSGVVDVLTGTPGAIGYIDASQIGDLSSVAVQVGDEYVPYSPEAAAGIVESSPTVEGRGQFDYAIELERDTTESGTYPIVLISYHLACTAYDDPNQAELVSDFLSYVVSEEGQQAAADAAGAAPISDTLRENAQEAVDAIGAN